ncbi:MAG TPA: hypothetical protein VMD09_04530 [Solirubrobacteraceae bacterium]|nr:hypothetical protein [Solirubrobacteraceae bacterium]
MAELVLDGDALQVRLHSWERAAAFHGDVTVPLSTVREISVDPDPWRSLRGIRAPGTGFPGVIAYGVRRMTGERPDFAAILGRKPAVRIELDAPAQFGRLLVTVPDAAATVAGLQGLGRG